jgi:hypothetical protein
LQRLLRVTIKIWLKSIKKKRALALGIESPDNEPREVDDVVDFSLQFKYGRKWRHVVRSRKKVKQERFKISQNPVTGVVVEASPLHQLSRTPTPTETTSSIAEATENTEIGESVNNQEQVNLENVGENPILHKSSEKKPALTKEEIEKEWDRGYDAWLGEIPPSNDPRCWHYEFLGEAYLHGMMDGEASMYPYFICEVQSLYEFIGALVHMP